jgi:hypothetical protein
MGIKRNNVDMGTYVPSEIESKTMRWCVSNNIRISPKARSDSEWSIVIDLNNKIAEDPKQYKKIEIWKKIFEYYKYYYDKYNNK